MIENQRERATEALRNVALRMMTAARTAPKARGVDNLEIAMVTGQDIVRMADKLKELAEILQDRAFFTRDAGNILQAEAVILIGTKKAVLGLNCGICGFPTCAAKVKEAPNAPCAFNMHDMGLAIGSAVATAADCRVDCRVMFSVGVAARQLGMLENCHSIMGIPISVTGKSPFFDR